MKLPNWEELQKIYHSLADDVSKKIYNYRLLYSLLGEKEQIIELAAVCLSADIWRSNKKICYYGAGMGGLGFLEIESKVPFIIDKYKTGSVCGVPIISLEYFLKLPDCKDYIIIVAVGKMALRDEIATELDQYGLHYILGYPGIQYFDLSELKLQKEYFADVGAEGGETSIYFLDHFKNGYAYALEPDPKYVEIARKRLRGYPQAEVFPFGAYDKNAVMRFDPTGDGKGSAKISEAGTLEVAVRKLDDLLGNRPVTFLKMDIEGSELAALRGAEHIIREQRPKLAICVYHKPEDMWEIPSLLLQYHPDYKLYLRHYSLCGLETVLYAI